MEQLRLKTSAELVQFAVRQGDGQHECGVPCRLHPGETAHDAVGHVVLSSQTTIARCWTALFGCCLAEFDVVATVADGTLGRHRGRSARAGPARARHRHAWIERHRRRHPRSRKAARQRRSCSSPIFTIANSSRRRSRSATSASSSRIASSRICCRRFAASWPDNPSSRPPSPAERSPHSFFTPSYQFLQLPVAGAMPTMQIAHS